MAGVRDHTELEAWKLSDAVRQGVYRLTSSIAFSDHRDLSRQLMRSAESACANIAEGFARYLPLDFARFLRIAKGSLSETMEHLRAAVGRGLISQAEAEALMGLARRARGACSQLIKYLESARAPGR